MFVDKSNKCFQMLLTANLTSLLEFPRILIVCLSFQFFLLFLILHQLLHHKLDWKIFLISQALKRNFGNLFSIYLKNNSKYSQY